MLLCTQQLLVDVPVLGKFPDSSTWFGSHLGQSFEFTLSAQLPVVSGAYVNTVCWVSFCWIYNPADQMGDWHGPYL